IGNRPAGELRAGARILEVVRAVDAQLSNAAPAQRAWTEATAPLSRGQEAIAIGGGGSGGGAHTLQEWFDSNGRELGLKRILLTMLALAGGWWGKSGGCSLLLTVFGMAQQVSNSSASAAPKADAIYIHADIYTGALASSQFSSIQRVEALAVRGDRIQAVGSNPEIQRFKGPETQVIDLAGKFVMPGFNDAHLHLADAGLQKLSVDFTGVKNIDELRARVEAKVGKATPGQWILGGGWDETKWPI